MRSSLLRSSAVSLLLLGLIGCGGDNGTGTKDGGGGQAAGKGGQGTGKAGEGGQGAAAGSGGVAGGGTAGAAGASLDAGLDLSGIAPPATLTASVKNRRETLFELVWTAPSINGAAVTGYQVRYAKVPITSTNFDDTTVTTAIAYAGTPKAPGETDGMEVKLYIENSYYFAVEGANPAGDRSPLDATTTAIVAHFEVATLKGTSGAATEGAGYALDGSGDANGDGKSDVLMGSYNNSMAYLYLGTTTFMPTAPSVVFTSATAGFGQGVAFIGDIDKDGREDLAIANPTTEVVYIYRGRGTWPMAMADTDADFKITADASYTGSMFGSSMTRLGDFNGDGVDDFVIGAPDYNASTFAGRVTVILGASGFAPLTLPSTTRAITIDGDATILGGLFGTRVMGIGPFYQPTAGSELIVSAPGIIGLASGNEGHIYAFRGQAASSGAIPLASADAKIVGASAGLSIGSVLTNLGIIGSAPPQVGAGNPNDTSVPGATGSAYLFEGNTTAGPFAAAKTIYYSATSLNPFAMIGGGIPGRATSVSTIGSSSPDVVLVPRNGGKVAIIDGDKFAGLAGTTDAAAVADVQFTLPSTLGPPNNSDGTLVPDVNGDGFADFAISDGASSDAGQVLVYW